MGLGLANPKQATLTTETRGTSVPGGNVPLLSHIEHVSASSQ